MATKSKKTMYKKQCKATTRSNAPCSKLPMKDSEYCWHHRFSRIGGTPLYTNSTFQFVATVILAIVIAGISFYKGPTKEGQKEILNGQEQILDNQERLLEKMAEEDKTLYPSLIKKYPLGYIIFATDHKQIVQPYNNRLSEHISIDSLSMFLSKITDEKIYILVIDLYIEKQHFGIKNLILSFPNKIGRSKRLFRFKYVNMYGEAVSKNKYGIICVLGFKERQVQ